MEKTLKTIQAPNINKLIAGANEFGIQKDDIVDIISITNGYILIYFS